MSSQRYQHLNALADNRRVMEREPLYRNENCYVQFTESGERWMVYNLTAFGALIKLTSALKNDFEIGQTLNNVRIFYHEKPLGRVAHGMIVHVHRDRGQTTIGLRLDTAVPSKQDRSTDRIRTNPLYLPTATCAGLVHYDDTMWFKILDLSNDGLRLETSARNRLLFVGSVLEPLLITLPTVGSFETRFEVKHMSFDSNAGRVVLGGLFLEKDSGLDAAIVRYMFAFPHQEVQTRGVERLRQAGFQPKFFKTHLKYGVVSNLETYREVLRIRHEAYGKKGKVDTAKSAGVMSDYYDLNSRIFYAQAGSVMVGSVRVTFSNTATDRFELEESLELPPNITRHKTFEVSRLCVSTAYENTDVVLGLIERAVALGLQEGFETTITSCTADKIDYYRKMGFRVYGKPFELATLNGIPHFFLMADTRSAAQARRMNPLYWRYAYSNVVSYLKNSGFLKNAQVSFLKRSVIRLAWPIFLWIRTKNKKTRLPKS